MSPLLAAAAVALALPVALGAYAVVGSQGRQLAIAQRNLTRGLTTSAPTSGSLESRGNGRTAFLRTVTPEREARRVRRLLQRAGSPAGWTMTRVLAAKPLLALGLGLVTLLAAAEGAGALWLLVLGAVSVGSYWLPDALLRGRGDERQTELARELPDVLDQMTISVEAGLGFEAAMNWVATHGTGPLSEEFRRTMADINVGRSRRDAYAGLVARAGVEDLRRFVAAVNQADTYGIAVSDVLRVQAAEMRVKRRQRAEEKAMKVPVKVSFPLMLCILPALLIVVLGPALVSIGDVLG
ncbi:type II secretion system F family protein [Klenkia sp. PcliD-1-E]|uniref:type II secretion system F family protein n=1 Tax=Klenkia sp. PcliD-1-E TaxID=2954492 RepID=UPI002096F19B|nr:type II secretion system F family protein [Klenkia sp. PcliD-1-E]MCO7219864.1 type II secretion system F family protein [Klenkia sp. PcliD-1-E]